VKRREFITLSRRGWATHGVRLAYLRRASAIGLAPLRISVSLIVLTGACWALMLHHAISMGGAMGVEVIGSEFTLGGLGVFLAVWTVMMGAMMLPSAAPMILTFAAAQARHNRNVVVPTWIFVAAYIFVWAYAGLVVYVLLHAGKDLVKSDAWAPLALGVTLTLAGLYQFTPLKRLCLRRCRSPLVFLKQHWRNGSEDGTFARRLLPRLLLGPFQCDGCCCRDDEHRLDACDDTGGICRKGVAARSPYLGRGGPWIDRSRAAGRKWPPPARGLNDAGRSNKR
jgi:predicted metal-binding membrane protein